RAAPGLAEHVLASHQLQSGGAAQVMALLERAHGLQRIATWPLPALRALCVLYRLTNGVARETLIDSLARHPHVRVAQALQEFAPLSDADAPRYNDPYVGLQRGFAEIGAASAHRLSVGRDVPIAVVDTAVDVDHPDLRGRIADSRDLVDAPKSAELRQARHGTQVAGIIGAAANNGQGIVGVAPAAQL